MKSIHFALALTLTIITISVGTYYQAVYSHRWSGDDSSEALEVMAEMLDNIPLEFGDWEGAVQKNNKDLDAQYKISRVVGHANIVYKNKKTKKIVSISLVCGKHQHVSIHTPNQCYVGAGYEQVNSKQERKQVDLADGPAFFFTSQFRKPGLTSADNQRIFWSWSKNGTWVAEGNRASLRRALGEEFYKLYVTTKIQGQQISDDVSLNREFIEDFVPVLNEALWPTEDSDNLIGS